MAAIDAYIPYGAYWSTPFARWQGSLSHLHSLTFAAHVASQALEDRTIPHDTIDYGVLGTTIPQAHSFYGLPWVTGLMGAAHVPGPTINQACATGASCLRNATDEVRAGAARCALVLTADRTSNGPHIYYPDPGGVGGTGTHENWVLDNFSCDPFAQVAMVETAENVAKKHQITTAEQHDVVLMRHAQYDGARSDGFHARFMATPFAVPDAKLRKTIATLEGDEGVFPTDAGKLGALSPVVPGGTVTYAAQTHPADGNVGMLVTDQMNARALSARPEIAIRVRGFGVARTEIAHMPQAPIPAVMRALNDAGVTMADIKAVTTHNPFAVNDILFARETGFALERMNAHGCSLIWGHPQAPTGLRSIIELIEGLVDVGGGLGLFTGCAAGDTGMSVVIEVSG
jgi:acetyl-CoA acetyltransferase